VVIVCWNFLVYVNVPAHVHELPRTVHSSYVARYRLDL
jgi:hypothetical protein